MHAHICQTCAKNGKETVWIHSDDNAGNIAGHTCPECGVIEWQKAIIRQPKKAHVHRNATKGSPSFLDSFAESALTAIILLSIFYLALQLGTLLGELFVKWFAKKAESGE